MDLSGILSRAGAGRPLDKADLQRLLNPAGPEERLAIQAAARAARARLGGEAIFTYGFVYLSSFCRNACRFCAFRRDNPQARRYRRSRDEILAAASDLAAQGVNLIDLTLGQDPASGRPGFVEELAELIAATAAATGLPVMISPGTAAPPALRAYREAGALWYACYQETHNRELFASLRPGQSYDERWNSKLAAKAAGLLVEEGVLCGVGESPEDLADSIVAMAALGAAQTRAMTFMPPPEALAAPPGLWVPAPEPKAARTRELDLIAALRLARPGALIPASLDVEGLAGLKDRLMAGADLITSLVPAGRGLAGVAQAELDIDNQGRSRAGLEPILAELGLRAAGPDDYRRRLQAATA